MDSFSGESENSRLTNLFEIESEEILSVYSEEDIKIFVKDLYLTFKIFDYIDHEYFDTESIVTKKDIEKFRHMVNDWNKKYRDILLEFSLGSFECNLKVYILEKAQNILPLVKKMKGYVSSKIIKNSSGEELETIFHGSDERNENSLNLRKEEGRLRMIYSLEDMMTPKSPEFRLCIFFALKGGYEKEINVKRYEKEFSFDLTSQRDRTKGEGWARWYPDVVLHK